MKFIRVLLLLGFASGAATMVPAEQLPVKTYTTADGLAGDEVFRIFQDSRGFLWFCTGEGLSRFDGYKFTNYGGAQGLQHRIVNDIIETPDGEYWIATAGGLAKYDPAAAAGLHTAGGKIVVSLPGDNERAKSVTTLFKDGAGNIWCGTSDGLYRIEKIGGDWQTRPVEIGLPQAPVESRVVRSIVEGRDGALWVGAESGLYRLNQTDGRAERYTTGQGLPSDKIYSLMRDRKGRVWAGTSSGLCQLSDRPQPGQNIVASLYDSTDGLIHNSIVSLLQSSDGRLWVGTRYGLSVLTPPAQGEKPNIQNYTTADGLSDIKVKTIREDSAGNVWLGTESIGAMKIARDGFVSYRVAEGLGHIRILSIFENLAGKLHVVSGSSDGGMNDQRYINHFDGKRFTAIRPNLAATKFLGQSWHQTAFQDHAGEWWIPTGEGLFRFPAVRDAAELARTRPVARYTTKDGLTGDHIYRLFEDSRRDIWISAIKPNRDLNKVDSALPQGTDMLTRWERSTGTFHPYTTADGVPQSAPTAFAEDRAGNLWIGFGNAHLARYREGCFMDFTDWDGPDNSEIFGLYLDRSGRLWIAYNIGGVTRIDNPEGDRPRFIRYTTAEGLSSDQAGAVIEDEWGSIYIGTGRGVDRLDVATGRIKHYTMADGLIGPAVHAAHRGRDGALWFATLRGLSRLSPQPERAALPPPPIRIEALSVDSVSQPVSDLGDTELAKLELEAGQNQIQIDFLGLGFGPGETLRYQHKLEGAENDWSAPTENRTVNFVSLAPGSYRFLVRAVSTDGAASANPASVPFIIRPPVWRRWWFLTLAALFAAALIYAFVRSRVARLRALRESETRFRTLAETASDAIITIDAESRIIFVNPAAERMFGHAALEMIGANLTMLMPECLRHLHRAGLERYVRTGRKHASWEAVELPGLHKDGHEIPLELAFGEFVKDDRRFFTGIARDITERKQAEEALRKNKEERLYELERVRTRIATDLHDDIGASLTQIVVLSEVAQQNIERADRSPVSAQLASISSVSNELVEAMSDIVWAINPQKDRLSDLTLRMRRLASDILTARRIAFGFRVPVAEEDIPLGANVRRELFLIFKESLNNIVKHSACARAEIELQVGGEWLTLTLVDDGHGFDPALAASADSRSRALGGNGLANMRRRAQEMGGELEIVSRIGSGTTVKLRIPVGPRPHGEGENPHPLGR